MPEIFNTKRFRIMILALLDLLSVYISTLGALALRFDIIPPDYYDRAMGNLPFYMVITIGMLALFRLYNRVWTYASTKEIFDTLKATVLIEGLILGLHVYREVAMPRSYYLIQFILLTVFLAGVRFGKVFLKSFGSPVRRKSISRRIMVVGAGDAASILIRDLKKDEQSAAVVCAIDDNPAKKNKYILGVPILGGRDLIAQGVEKYDVREIILAMPSVPPSEIKELIQICQQTGCQVKILPSVTKSLTTSLAREVRPVSYEDLLGRDPIYVNQQGIRDFLRGKVVLVTGGGGSIGAELCRQIVPCEPKKLIIFDIYENSAYDIQMELEQHYPDINLSVLIGSIRDYDRLQFVFQKYKPDIVFHAAAHKHVPLMEKSPNEAVKNNCLGTWNLARLADQYQVDNFILISTDKAVRPTNIMGATKRICEMIVQTYARKSEHTRFAAVRFGNVLGSNGSVIPLFLKQIEEGGPVTVTHRDITRFFMTIPEAVSLVLQAGQFAKGGEIFVLNMGEPVKIYDLAENLIRMKGYKPGEDMDIRVVGLRPGEKLYEEILMDEEGLDQTENKMIFVGKPLQMDQDRFLGQLQELIDEAEKNGTQIKEKMEEVCGTYTITDN